MTLLKDLSVVFYERYGYKKGEGYMIITKLNYHDEYGEEEHGKQWFMYKNIYKNDTIYLLIPTFEYLGIEGMVYNEMQT